MKLRSCLVALFVATSARAGWTSGGGELAKDAANPWFIQNTEIVQACIDSDAEHFHLPAAAADLQHDYVEKVIAYWQAELAAGEPAPDPSRKATGARVGTQRFQFGPCTAATDVRFQFGTLRPEQMAHFKALGQDPRDYISIAVRTDYDTVHLRGRGFIYIAADSGDLQPRDSDVIDRPWAQGEGGLLLKVLAHEMGHVFGVPHTNGSSGAAAAAEDLMNGSFPEAVVTLPLYTAGLSKATIPPFFTAATASGNNSCFPIGISAGTLRFLGVASVNCLGIERQADHVDFFDIGRDGQKQVIGSATFAPSHYRTNGEYPMRLWLPDEQKVIAVVPGGQGRNIVLGLKRYTTHQIGSYRNAAGTVTRSVLMTVTPGSSWFTVAGQLDTGLFVQLPQLDASPP